MISFAMPFCVLFFNIHFKVLHFILEDGKNPSCKKKERIQTTKDLSNNQEFNNQIRDKSLYFSNNQDKTDPVQAEFASSGVAFKSVPVYPGSEKNLIFQRVVLETKEEIDFFNLIEEKNKNTASYENICTEFKESVSGVFLTYLNLKKKLLYLYKFMPSALHQFKNDLILYEEILHLKNDIQLLDYFEDFIYLKIIHPCQNKNLNLDKYEPARNEDRKILLFELQKLHPCAFALFGLLTSCPTTIYLENEYQLYDVYPNFYKKYKKREINRRIF